MTQLKFSELRAANLARLPLFKNNRGEPAHSRPNGSDWSPAMWFVALLGEIGEYAQVRVEFEEGRLPIDRYQDSVAKELADVQTYLDLNAERCNDLVMPGMRGEGRHSAAQQIMTFMAVFGLYCEARKKFVRGDDGRESFNQRCTLLLGQAFRELQELMDIEVAEMSGEVNADRVLATTRGVDLGVATRDKFNAVSDRVGCSVKL